MRFGKLTMFFLLQAIAAFLLLCYFGLWMINGKATGTVVRPYFSNTLTVSYSVNNQEYIGSYSRYDIPFSARSVTVRYLLFHPSSSRINSFMGIAAEPLAWWLVFLLASAMLLLTHNTVFSRGTIFQIQKKFPWLSMDEYFPEDARWWWYEKTERASQKPVKPKLITREKEN